MKRMAVCGLVLAFLLGGCHPVSPTLPPSMKGYELYSWQDGGQWYFSLLVGTNREKTREEIQAADTILAGGEALQAALESLPAGEYITWRNGDGLAFPPEEIIQQVEQICAAGSLELSLVR